MATPTIQTAKMERSSSSITKRSALWSGSLTSESLPLLALMYLFNALDKSNLGNAKTAGKSDLSHGDM